MSESTQDTFLDKWAGPKKRPESRDEAQLWAYRKAGVDLKKRFRRWD